MSFVALLKAEPNEATAKEIVENSQLLNRTHLRHLVDNIGDTSQDKIPERVKIAFCKFVLLDADMQNSNNQYAANNAANFLADIGGQKTGDILSSVLLNPTTNINIKSAAARALGTIKNYDSIPTLIKASKINGVPIGVIAEAMGTISDPRAIPALKDMAQYDRINRPDKLWIAAALARFDQNYEENAKIIRELLPSSMSQAAWLDDSKTIKALTIYAQNPTTYFGNRAVKSLEVVESSESLQTLAILAEEEPLNTLHLQIFSAAASRLAKKLQHPSEAYWTSVLSVTAAIRAWFTTSQNIRPEPRNRQSFAVILENPSLARRVWIAEVTRRLDVAAPKNKDDYRTNIPIHALIAVEDIFGTDLVPVLKRIITESHDKISHNGKLSKVDFYHLRSRAAKILTDKTGQQYTFVDVDGRTHPGGWHPSQEE